VVFLQDVVNGLADALGTDAGTAGMVLTGMMLLSVGITLGLAKANMVAIAITLLGILAMCFMFGWAPFWLLVLVVLMTSAMFGSQLMRWLAGD